MPPAKRATKATKKAAKAPAKRRGPAKMTAEHKRALAVGREQSRHVAAYLDALAANKPKRGRKRTPESIRKQLGEVAAKIPTASGVKKLEFAHTRIALERELETLDIKVDLTGLRKNFLKHAKAYSERKGYSYQAWRDAGVSAQDLTDAGITRAGS